jgi:hypothetical protein
MFGDEQGDDIRLPDDDGIAQLNLCQFNELRAIMRPPDEVRQAAAPGCGKRSRLGGTVDQPPGQPADYMRSRVSGFGNRSVAARG